jgi:hypothetical protein
MWTQQNMRELKSLNACNFPSEPSVEENRPTFWETSKWSAMTDATFSVKLGCNSRNCEESSLSANIATALASLCCGFDPVEKQFHTTELTLCFHSSRDKKFTDQLNRKRQVLHATWRLNCVPIPKFLPHVYM